MGRGDRARTLVCAGPEGGAGEVTYCPRENEENGHRVKMNHSLTKMNSITHHILFAPSEAFLCKPFNARFFFDQKA